MAIAQIEDCVGAYPVCGNGDISFTPKGTGANDFAIAGNNMPDCFRGENKTTWLRIKIKQAGSLGFDLIPDNLTGPSRDDYDFAVYGPNRECGNLGNSIRCSTTNPQQANVGAETGLRESESDVTEGPGTDGNGYIKWLEDVKVGEFYYIFIDNFSENQGYTLKWTGTALLDDIITKDEGGVDLGEDITICDGNSYTIDGSMLGGKSYLWNTGATTETLDVSASGEYSVTVITESGCISTDNIQVTFVDNPVIDAASISPDFGCDPAMITFSAQGSPGNYEWFDPAGNSVGSGQTLQLSDLSVEQSGVYKVVLTAGDCTDEETVSVSINPSYFQEFNVEQCPGNQFTIPETGQILNQSDTITVALQTRELCDSIIVYNVNFLGCGDNKCNAFPNSFAPNGNNTNEFYRPTFKSICTPTEFEMVIFNRWGEEVFRTDNSTLGWDGNIDGEPAQPAIYLWKMRYKFPDNPNQAYQSSGSVTLVR